MITNIVLTQKEKMLLQDQKSHEEICIEKYTNYANIAKDPQLKQLFLTNAQNEREHLNTINQLLSGQVPQMSGQQSGGQQMSGGQSGGGQQMGSGMQSGGSQQMGSGMQSGQQQSGQGNSGMKMGGSQGTSNMQMGGSQQMSSGMQSGGSQQMGGSMQSGPQQSGSSNFQATDKELCTDLLMTEKYVSGAYNIAIFEFKDPQVRDVLNHIQKEEQKHGESIFKYMESKGLYQAQ